MDACGLAKKMFQLTPQFTEASRLPEIELSGRLWGASIQICKHICVGIENKIENHVARVQQAAYDAATDFGRFGKCCLGKF